MIRFANQGSRELWRGHWRQRIRDRVPVRRLERFLLWLVSFLGLRAEVKGPVMRFYIFSHRSWLGRLLNRGLYLHYMLESDTDRELHNHPFYWSTAFILDGGYSEELAFRNGLGSLRTGAYWVAARTLRPGMLNRIYRDTFHRITLDNGPCWTLFYSGPRVDRPRGKDWQFLDTKTGAKIYWSEFAANE